ncbi:MAG: DUF4365 domain-containing protein [Verrucomicrobiota bacterium]|jgi:hypothetical protein
MDKPQRPKEHVTGDIAQTSVALIFKRWGWTADIVQSDYGEDVESNIFAEGQRTNLYFRCQVKGKSLGDEVTETDDGYLSVTIKASICRQWVEEYFPIFIAVYDVESGRAYWCDPMPQLRADYSRLGQESISFRLSRESDLANSRQLLSGIIEKFYAKLLRLDDFSLACDVYPVLMPGYRSESVASPFVAFNESRERDEMSLERCQTNLNWLPSWMTVLKTLQPRFISGFNVQTQNQDLEAFIKSARDVVSKSGFELLPGEWLSFIFSPIELTSRDKHPKHQTPYAGELTHWQCMSKIGEKLVEDRQYAFAPPEGFLREVSRRHLSWDSHFYVCPELDLAVQFFARVSPTPDDFLRAEQFKKHIHSQMLPWRCLAAEAEAVHRAVASDGFVFMQTPEAETEPGWVSGVITMHATNPHLGVFHLVMDWREFGQRPIAAALEKTGTLARLPGEEATVEVWAIIEKLFGHLYAQPPEELLVALPDHVNGVPINHKRRVIEISRFRKKSSVDPFGIDKEKFKEALSQALRGEARVTEFQCEKVKGLVAFNRYALYMEPALEISSKDCFTLIKDRVVRAFDTLEQRECGGGLNTKAILEFDGQIDFERE